MDVQLAEAAAELLVLVVRHLLVAEEDHQVLHQRVVHFLELLVAERLGEVDAGDLRADRGRQLAHRYGFVRHRFLPSGSCRHCHASRNAGFRFSTKAAMPSSASAVRNDNVERSASIFSPS